MSLLGKRKNQSNPLKNKKLNKTNNNTDFKNKNDKSITKKKNKNKKFIEIPGLSDDDNQADSGILLEESDNQIDLNDELIDQDVELGEEAMQFLNGLDKKGITRSRLDQVIENRKNRPKQSIVSKSYASLPKLIPENENEDDANLDDLDEDDLAFGSGTDDLDLMSDMPSSASDFSSDISSFDHDDDWDSEDLEEAQDNYQQDTIEENYYATKRPKHAPSDSDDSDAESIETKLPIRNADGTLQRFPKPAKSVRNRVVKSPTLDKLPLVGKESNPPPTVNPKTKIDSSLGSRFGRQALSDLLSPTHSLKSRIQSAKLEIAELSQEALADPEMSLGSIKRILAMSCPTLSLPHEKLSGQKIKIDAPVRMMAILSLLTIFLDIIPGYRIRPISDAEKQAKVSQMVARQREWEDALVNIYRKYLEVCEKEIFSNSLLSSCSLKSLCHLLRSKTHFNFSRNIMNILVRKLGSKEWDELSQECFESIVTVFEKDTKGEDSLELVRMIRRIVKSKNYNVHPELLATLLSLRLKNEISSDVRASTDKVYSSRGQSLNQRGGKLPWKDRVKVKALTPVVMSKKAKKAMKERAGIEKEIQEAEESVRVEDKERNQTETLKMIFGLYFRVIKLPYRSAILPVALQGISRFAHLVNVDFFRDLLEVLRKQVQDNYYIDSAISTNKAQQANDKTYEEKASDYKNKLLCIITAFELLLGQGEALNLDLTDFVNSFYGLLLPLSTIFDVEEGIKPVDDSVKSKTRAGSSSIGDLLIKALELIFLMSRSVIPPIRALAFAKRLLTVSLSFPSTTTLKIIEFINKLAHRQPAVKTILMLSNPDEMEDRTTNGAYKAEVDEPELSNANCAIGWELILLQHHHWDCRVRQRVDKLIQSIE
ncbi:hypothetical protein O181_004935 [Austropuccinia psidii MF-1]|uniref:Nucleolar complex-associated protein 3 n=1 Tax=Austropuccinia psidii MF-1 TaxID=1389203 RepID=A0A9Q3GFC3_9BASI|nr:hypothetical protein [Austropuccinia psidii MF-1]